MKRRVMGGMLLIGIISLIGLIINLLLDIKTLNYVLLFLIAIILILISYSLINRYKSKNILFIIPILLLILYIIYINWVPLSKELTFTYDFGEKKNNVLKELEIDEKRLSEPRLSEDFKVSYKKMEENSLFFTFQTPPRLGEKINLIVKLRGKIPSGSLLLGVKSTEDWKYNYKELYNSRDGKEIVEWEEYNVTFSKEEIYIENNKIIFRLLKRTDSEIEIDKIKFV